MNILHYSYNTQFAVRRVTCWKIPHGGACLLSIHMRIGSPKLQAQHSSLFSTVLYADQCLT